MEFAQKCHRLPVVIFYLLRPHSFIAFRKEDVTWQIPDIEKVRFEHYTYKPSGDFSLAH